MSGTLYVVATPIGNLEDITLRALRVLREVSLVAAEDTRRTARLLAHHGIRTPTQSFHEHNAHARVPQMIARLAKGESVALVSDAGTPGISDPGLELVKACVDRGLPIDPIPGPSATVTALVASGFPAVPMTFFGFPPHKASDRTRWWSAVSGTAHTCVAFESPHRIDAFLREAAEILGDRPLFLGREMTKAHQEFLRGRAAEIAVGGVNTRGEFTAVIGPARLEETASPEMPPNHVVVAAFRRLTNIDGLGRRAAVAALARRYGRSAREVYAAIEAAKDQVS